MLSLNSGVSIVNRRRKAARPSSEMNDGGTSLGADANPDDGSCCPSLLPKHKIFLSHSGKQKWFVEKLCEDLEAHHRFPFFDKRPSSLPKGERFPKLILEAAKQCELAVVVVSEEFLTSKWPMIELSTFVRALSRSNPGLKILPLFFGMTVNDLGSHSKLRVWSKVWEEWAKKDARMKSMEFEEALRVMRSFNGNVFDGDMNNVWRYERDVVESICSMVVTDVKWEDSHVQGRATMCAVTRENMKEIEPLENGIRVFGYYGVGGIGKTTMCKTLCNELCEFLGKVCHVELGGTQSVDQMVKEVLKKLTNTSEEVLKKLDEGECRNILKNRSVWRQRTFLVIDNVWDDEESMKQAEMFMNDPAFCEGSVVMVTSRCRRTLMHVGIEERHCFEVPELGEEDARKLFLHHAARGKQFGNDGGNVVISKCIARCWFRKSEIQGYHYLPLALQVLGVHLRRCGPSPSKWLEELPKVRDFNRFEGDNPVFSILRLNFDRLLVQLQALFMDVAAFRKYSYPNNMSTEYVGGYFGWLSLVHRQKLQDTQSQLLQLRERGLLGDVNMESEEVSMHDLYKEFAKMEAKGELNSSACFNGRKWVYCEGYPLELESTPSGGCWEKLLRVWVEIEHYSDPIFNMQGIQWRCFPNLVVLSLLGCSKVKLPEVWNFEGLRCLRSLTLSSLIIVEGVDGLKDLKNLTIFVWQNYGGDRGSGLASFGQVSTSIRVLNLKVVASLTSNMLDRCTNLLQLSLLDLRVDNNIDLRQCTSLQYDHLEGITGLQTLSISSIGSLQHVHLVSIKGLQTLLISSIGSQSCLESLVILYCKHLIRIYGSDDLVRLEYLNLTGNRWLEEVPDLQKLTSLQVLKLNPSPDLNGWDAPYDDPNVMGWEPPYELDNSCDYFAEVDGLGSLKSLREIRCRFLSARLLPNFYALKHLRHINLMDCANLTHLDGVEGLTALRVLELEGCSSLSRLPDLSNLTALEVLKLEGCSSLSRLPDLSNLTALEVLKLEGCSSLSRLPDLNNLTALEVLKLEGCSSLSRLPDLSNSTKLEELGFGHTGIELHEAETAMLASLPLLYRVYTSFGVWFPKDMNHGIFPEDI